MPSAFPEFTYGDKVLLFCGLSGSGKTTTQKAMGITYEKPFSKSRRMLAELFSQDITKIVDQYKFGRKWTSDKLAQQLSFIPETNKKYGISGEDSPYIIFPTHSHWARSRGLVPKGYESTGIQLTRFNLPDFQLGIVEFGNLLLQEPESVMANVGGDENYKQLTKQWMETAQGKGTEKGCMGRTLDKLPKDTRYIWLVDFDLLARTSIEEPNYYVKEISDRISFFEEKFFKIEPAILVMKTDYASINLRETILGGKWETSYGLELLGNCGYSKVEAEKIQSNLLQENPPADSLKPIFNAVQKYFDKYSEKKGRVIGGGSIFNPDYNVLVSSIIDACR